MGTIRKDEHRERKARNKAVVAAMTDEELQEIKALINAEQVKRMKREIERLGT